MYKKIISFVAIAAFVFFAAYPIASFAADPALTCSPSSANVAVGQQVTFTASGGNGTYSWNAPGMATQSGSSLTVYYPWSGGSFLTVSSGNQTAVCNVTITGSVLGDSTLSCGPLTRSVAVGVRTTFAASGGTGSYVWTAPQMTPQTGSTLTVYYPYAGNSSVTVTSGGQSTTCLIAITGGTSGTPSPTPTPGLPNTGQGGALNTLLLNLGMVLGLSGITALFVNKKINKAN